MKTASKKFRCDNVRIYFFYPIVTSSWALKLGYDGNSQFPSFRSPVNKIFWPEYVKTSDLNLAHINIGPSAVIEELPTNDVAFEPASYIPIVHAWCGEDSDANTIMVPITLTINECDERERIIEKEASLFYSCDIFKSGAGCAILRVDLKKSEDKISRDLILALTTSGQRNPKVVEMQVGSEKKTLYSIFLDLTRSFMNEVSFYIMHGKEYEPLDNENLKWIDFEMCERSPSSEREKSHLTPYVLTMLYGVKGLKSWQYYRQHKRPWIYRRAAKIVENSLVPLLLRSHRPDTVDRSFIAASALRSHLQLPNMSPTVDFFVHFHLRSCLAIGADQNDTMVQDSELLLKETLKLLRMRWYHLVVSDLRLDEALTYVCSSLSRPRLGYSENGTDLLSHEKIESEHQFREKFRIVILNSRASTLSAFHDPETYRIGSGSLIELYVQAASQLDLDELEKNIARKLDSLGLLYRDVIEHWRLGETELLMDEWDRLWKEKKKR